MSKKSVWKRIEENEPLFIVFSTMVGFVIVGFAVGMLYLFKFL